MSGSTSWCDKGLQQMVLTFCQGEEWADPNWRTLPHVRPLFRLVEELETKSNTRNQMSNKIIAIQPYKLQDSSVWVFDDAQHQLVREPFVGQINQFIDCLAQDLVDPEAGITLLGSAQPFPGATRLTRIDAQEEDYGGAFYQFEPWADTPGQDVGWLCPALLHYFPAPPAELWVKAEA